MIESILLKSFVGTAEYISPELLEQKVASRQSDIWAIGCIIYQMFCGRPAFRGATEFLTFQKVRGQRKKKIVCEKVFKCVIAGAQRSCDLS